MRSMAEIVAERTSAGSKMSGRKKTLLKVEIIPSVMELISFLKVSIAFGADPVGSTGR